ncbi:MAG TPA: glycosyltransferase family 9 protein [Chloroflexia bacterium]|nr:glycosyltransferase family 9 protein [Chloroflexia bacterium]
MLIQSVLVIPFADGIGDFINMQPLLAAIRAHFPEAEISVAVSEHGNLLCNDSAIRPVKPSWFNHEPGKATINLRWLLPQTALAWFAGPIFEYELGPFDLVVNCFFAWERAMDFRRTWTPQVPPAPEVVHSLDCLADELERELSITIAPEARKPHLVLRPEAQAEAARFLAEHGLANDAPLVALVPGTNMAIKRWPLAHWLELDSRLRAARPDVRTLLFCDRPLDRSSVATAFACAGSPAVPCYAPLDQVAALLARCRLTVSVDTGLLHMAGALNIPWIGLFGPTNPDVTGPYDPSWGEALIAPFRKPATCAACWKQAFKYEDDRCRTLDRGSCMNKLAVSPVLHAVLRRLRLPHQVPVQPGWEPAPLAAAAAFPVNASPALGF